MGLATLQNWRGKLESSRLLLWVLLVAFPYPYIANTLRWMTAELGRQTLVDLRTFSHARRLQQSSWQRRRDLHADRIHRLYFVLGLLFLGLTGREITKGPEGDGTTGVDLGKAVGGMIATWYAVVSFMLIIYIVLDGRNFGAGCCSGLSPRLLENATSHRCDRAVMDMA